MIDLVNQQGLCPQCVRQLLRPLGDGLFGKMTRTRKRRFTAFDSGKIELRSEEIDDLAGLVANRADEERVPETAAVLPVVQDIDGDIFFSRNRVAYLCDRRRIGLGTLKETAIPSDQLLRAIAGEA